MTQPPTLDDQRAIARRLFEALCAKYPERYIALIQPRDTAADGLSAPDLTARRKFAGFVELIFSNPNRCSTEAIGGQECLALTQAKKVIKELSRTALSSAASAS